jgi:hypothetical protein
LKSTGLSLLFSAEAEQDQEVLHLRRFTVGIAWRAIQAGVAVSARDGPVRLYEASLLLAIKLLDFVQDGFLETAQREHTVDAVVEMEARILTRLQWNLDG